MNQNIKTKKFESAKEILEEKTLKKQPIYLCALFGVHFINGCINYYIAFLSVSANAFSVGTKVTSCIFTISLLALITSFKFWSISFCWLLLTFSPLPSSSPYVLTLSFPTCFIMPCFNSCRYRGYEVSSLRFALIFWALYFLFQNI